MLIWRFTRTEKFLGSHSLLPLLFDDTASARNLLHFSKALAKIHKSWDRMSYEITLADDVDGM